jgi:hypothetical protein
MQPSQNLENQFDDYLNTLKASHPELERDDYYRVAHKLGLEMLQGSMQALQGIVGVTSGEINVRIRDAAIAALGEISTKLFELRPTTEAPVLVDLLNSLNVDPGTANTRLLPGRGAVPSLDESNQPSGDPALDEFLEQYRQTYHPNNESE